MFTGSGVSNDSKENRSVAAVPAAKFGSAALALVSLAALAAAQSAPWRYDLRPGDHLTYHYTLERDVQGEGSHTQVQVTFQTEVLVAGRGSRGITIGFQRNRQSAELRMFQVNGKDRLAKEQAGFEKRLQKRPSRFSEAMDISPDGIPRYSWEMARESPSHLLSMLHEVMTLPPGAVKQGEAWRGATFLPLDFRWTANEPVHGRLCHRVEGASADGGVKFTYWWSPDTSVVEQVQLDGSYAGAGAVTHERARMELAGRVRDETVEHWLQADETRQAALQALLLNPSIPVPAQALSAALATRDERSQALALAVSRRRRIALPAAAVEPLRQSASTDIRVLAGPEVETVASTGAKCPTAPKSSPEKFGTQFRALAATRDDPEIPYLLRVPLTYREDRPAPLLVYLSGGAGLAMDGVNTADDVVTGTDYLVLYPHAADYWWKPEMARRFNAVLSDVLARYNVDRNRIYLAGFSNGGTGSLYFAELWPQRFAAVVSLMGAGQCMDPVKQGLANLTSVPLLFVHGERDARVAPECSTATHAALREMQTAFKPELKMLPERDHDITLQSDDGLTLAFLQDKVRNPLPRRLEFTFTDPQAPRHYWIEILDGKPGAARVEARAKSDNTVEIRSHDVKRLRVYLRAELLPKTGPMRVEWNGKRLFEGSLQPACPAASEGLGDTAFDDSDRREFSLP